MTKSAGLEAEYRRLCRAFPGLPLRRVVSRAPAPPAYSRDALECGHVESWCALGDDHPPAVRPCWQCYAERRKEGA